MYSVVDLAPPNQILGDHDFRSRSVSLGRDVSEETNMKRESGRNVRGYKEHADRRLRRPWPKQKAMHRGDPRATLPSSRLTMQNHFAPSPTKLHQANFPRVAHAATSLLFLEREGGVRSCMRTSVSRANQTYDITVYCFFS